MRRQFILLPSLRSSLRSSPHSYLFPNLFSRCFAHHSFGIQSIAEGDEDDEEDDGGDGDGDIKRGGSAKIKDDLGDFVGLQRASSGSKVKRPSGGRKKSARKSIALNADTNVDLLLEDLGLEEPKVRPIPKVEPSSSSGALDMSDFTIVEGQEAGEDTGFGKGGIDDVRESINTKIVRGKRASILLRKETLKSEGGWDKGRNQEGNDQILPLPCCTII